MDKELRKQEDVGKAIEKLHESIKRDLRSRRTPEYVKRRRDELKNLWEEFDRRHESLIKSAPQDNEYITNDFYGQVQRIYIEANECMIGLPNVPSSPLVEPSGATKIETPIRSLDRLEPTFNLGQPSGSKDLEAKTGGKDNQSKSISIKLSLLRDDIINIRRELSRQRPAKYLENLREKIELEWRAIKEKFMEEERDRETIEHYNEVGGQVLSVIDDVNDAIFEETENIKMPLPSRNIPEFDGNYLNWTAFHDIFNIYIHENKKLSGAEKLQFLKLSLRGKAAELLNHINISNNNYDTAWELLLNRYNNKRLLVRNHINNILSLAAIGQASSKNIRVMLDTINRNLPAIENLGIPTKDWGPLIVHLMLEKLDSDSISWYEQTTSSSREVPTLEEFTKFLEGRYQRLEMIEASHKKTGFGDSIEQKIVRCCYCELPHKIYNCKRFLGLSISERLRFVRKINFCQNCLSHTMDKKCSTEIRCYVCQRPHHTLLHVERNQDPRKNTSSNVLTEENAQSEVLLATAVVNIKNYEGTWVRLRALIDSGSQSTFISERAAQTLGLPKTRTNIEVSGVGNTKAGKAIHKIGTTLKPRFPSEFSLGCEMLIINKLTPSLPTKASQRIRTGKIQNYILADPNYNIPGSIDLIIGADNYYAIAKAGIQKFSNGYLGQNTEFGWIISGRSNNKGENLAQPGTMISVNTILKENQLEKFWESEEIQCQRKMSRDEMECENIFKKTLIKHKNKYMVALPLKGSVTELGESRRMAMARLLQMEKKFQTNEEFQQLYIGFMKEYEDLGHMKPDDSKNNEEQTSYFIPHHAVMKRDSSTTKLRVVFDASSKTTSGKSLNDLMYTGPRLQENLSDILLRWRKHKIVLSADIEKMYRQISINEGDQSLHKILWRYNSGEPIREYKLTTVTYGTAAAPYLAVRTLHQLAQDEEKNFPEASRTVLQDFYVDDLITGCDSEGEAKQLETDLIALLQKGNFNLRKWRSNMKELVGQLPEDLQEKQFLEIKEDETRKMLGIHWAPVNDIFKYYVEMKEDNNPTKRKIASQVAKIYDPLGWLAPITICAKLLIQKLWVSNHKWDEPISEEVQNKWIKIQRQLYEIQNIRIPRWIKYDKTIQSIELHGFCDASEQAYGAVAYSRIIDHHGQIFVTLLQAKSKVAPLKIKKTLARLELCGAVLLSNLLVQIVAAMKIDRVNIRAWSDSMITLAWIRGRPERWKTFVANRVSEILENTSNDDWNYVKSTENPADLITRGIEPQKLAGQSLWWNGPAWLREVTLPEQLDEGLETNEEIKTTTVTLITTVRETFDVLERYSSLHKLLRVIAYCKRFIEYCRKQPGRNEGITSQELRQSSNCIIRIIQSIHFPSEVGALSRKQNLNKRSPLLTLLPFLDENGIIRVGGRLKNSSLSFNEKHPIIIPRNSHVTKLIIHEAHMKTLHGGNQHTHAVIRQKYWILRGKSSVRQYIGQCLKCVRERATTAIQVMGQLPEQRVRMSLPFTHTGVDYAGPFQLRISKGRGNKSYKGYIAVFVCMATKAIHLEVVSDMTTESFLAALRRFQARRGCCTNLYSDNGKNFVGAKRVLDKELQLAMKQQTFLQSLASDGITWHFAPPAAPHFGGLWEAGVKSLKYHLKRIVGDNTLTFEEMNTVVCQIEAALNSRPLYATTDDANEDMILTPSHLLIGRSLVTQSDAIDLDPEASITTRWKLIQKIKRDFWNVWSREYLHRLQQRHKWHTPTPNIKEGDVVLLKDENTTPTKWPLAKVVEVCPGQDSRVRVASVKTAGGAVYKRPIVKMCPLPFLTCVLLCMVTLVTPGFTMTTHTIKNLSSGLYVEKMGDAVLNRGLVRIDVPLNISTLVQHEQIINGTIEQYKRVCDLLTTRQNDSQCHEQLLELQQRYGELTQQRSVAKYGWGGPRTRRGLLGKLLTSIFGVNDEVYTDIAQLDTNQRKLIQDSNQQGKIMLKTLASLNTTEQRMIQKLNEFAGRLNRGLSQIATIDSWYKRVDVNTLSVHLLAIYQLADEVLRVQEHLYGKLLGVLHGGGHPMDFFTIAEFKTILDRINSWLPLTLRVVVQRIKEVQLAVEKETSFLHIFLFIVEKIKFELINVTPVPQLVHGDTYVSIRTQNESPIIGIDYNNQIYFEISHQDLHQALQLASGEFMCSPSELHNINSKPNCLIDIIYSRTYAGDVAACHQRTFRVRGLVWKRLYMPNTWMFISPAPTRVSLTCNGGLEDLWLNGTGIVRLDQGCTLDSMGTILKGVMTSRIGAILTLHKPILLRSNVTRDLGVDTTWNHSSISFMDGRGEFQDVVQEETMLHKQVEETMWEKIKPHVSGPTMVTAIIISLTLCLGFGVILYFWRRGRPTPRFILASQTTTG